MGLSWGTAYENRMVGVSGRYDKAWNEMSSDQRSNDDEVKETNGDEYGLLIETVFEKGMRRVLKLEGGDHQTRSEEDDSVLFGQTTLLIR